MPRQGNVIVVFQQFVHKTLNCIEGDAEGDDDPTRWLNLWQKKTMKNKNWDNASLKLAMDSVETSGSLQTVAQRWGAPTTSLHNHIYEIIYHEKEGQHGFYKNNQLGM